ncbi:MAG: ATPase [Mycobacterium sp.]|nr:ATPase [Mycobacterium sp.]
MICERCGLRPAAATVRAVARGLPPRDIRLCEVCLREGQLAAHGINRGLFDEFLASLFRAGSLPGDGSSEAGTGGPGMVTPGGPEVRHLDITQFFSESTRRVVRRAGELAQQRGSSEVDDDDLLGAVLEDEGIERLLARLDIDPGQLLQQLAGMRPQAPLSTGSPDSLTPDAKRALLTAFDMSRAMRSSYLGPEHLLLAMAADPTSPIGRMLQRAGLTPESLREQSLREPPLDGPGGGGPTRTPTLDQYGRDLTALARDGKLDPVIGREQEIEQTIEVLARRMKNNPVLVGDAGVGKTAIVEGIAQCIAQGGVPESLRGRRLISLDLAGMLAGTRYRGEFEERLKGVMDELTEESAHLMLFIDEIHTIVGAGAAEGAMDAANMLKPALSRGELHVIGATTLDEYRKSIERDPALERRFQPITVDQLTVEDTVAVLMGLKDRYEAFHRVRITDEAIRAAAELSDRYIADRFLPDKAIDLIDQAGARLQIRTAGRRDANELRERMDRLTREKDQAVAAEDYELAQRLKNELVELAEQLDDATQQRTRAPEVTAEDIAAMVARSTGIPVAQVSLEERERLLHLEDRLHQRVLDQEEAVRVVAEAVRRSRAGLGDVNRPVGSFLFLGPTGVGKTELARALAEALFGDADLMVRFDMSEFQERHTVSRLVGAPPGYVGYEEAGQLTERIRRRPYAVLLFDEFEKAHPDVFNLLLQLLDDGHLTDGQGRRVSFTNTIVIMTSNFGAEQLSARPSLGFAAGGGDRAFEAARDQLIADLRRSFRPELINRIDEIVVFHPLTRDQLLGITRMMLDGLRARLRARGIDLQFSDEAVELVADAGYDPDFGARPLRRAVQRLVENELSGHLLRDAVAEGDVVAVSLANGRLQFDVRRGAAHLPDEPTWEPPRDIRLAETAGPAEPRD